MIVLRNTCYIMFFSNYDYTLYSYNLYMEIMSTKLFLTLNVDKHN